MNLHEGVSMGQWRDVANSYQEGWSDACRADAIGAEDALTFLSSKAERFNEPYRSAYRRGVDAGAAACVARRACAYALADTVTPAHFEGEGVAL